MTISDGQCLTGVRPDGTKERVAIGDGVRESKYAWCELLLDLKARGLQSGPPLAAGDGAMRSWAILAEVFPKTQHQRSCFHYADCSRFCARVRLYSPTK